MGGDLLYAVFGGMKGITYTQVAQYVVLIIAYTIPAVFISLQLTGNPIPPSPSPGPTPSPLATPAVIADPTNAVPRSTISILACRLDPDDRIHR